MRSHAFCRWRIGANLRRLHLPAALFWWRALNTTTDREIG